MKNYFMSILLFVFLFCSCSNEIVETNPRDVLNFILFKIHPDVYPTEIYNNIREHSVKSIEVISNSMSGNVNDSLTILKFDKNGRLDKRITKECTTIGCLPYMNLQQYHYSEDLIQRIDIYTFKNNNQSTKSMWETIDFNELEKFDWEDYLYSSDTIKVESAISNWIFLKDDHGNIVERTLKIKSTGQTALMNFNHTDSSSIAKYLNLSGDILRIVEYKFVNNKVEVRQNVGDESILFQIWHLNDNGLISEKINYSSGEVISRTKFIYSFYSVG